MPKGAEPVNPPKIYGSSLPQLLNLLKRPEYRYRYWAKREIREMEPIKVKSLEIIFQTFVLQHGLNSRLIKEAYQIMKKKITLRVHKHSLAVVEHVKSSI